MHVTKTDLVDQVYQAIRKQILSGTLNPKSPLRQEELAEQLGVSRQPVSHARGAIDGLAAYLCATQVNNEVRNLLNKLVDQGDAATGNGSIQSLALADIAFHRALYERSGNPEIMRLADQSWSHMVRSMHQVLENQSLRSGIWDDHRAIAEAIIDGDPELARERATEHANSAGQMTYQRLTNS